MVDEHQLRFLFEQNRIARLKWRYCYCIDEGLVDQFVELFTEDAKVNFATREPYDGRPEIRRFIETHLTESDQMMHIALNPLISIEDADATGKWYYIVFINRESGTEMGQGTYYETYRLENDEWKIESLRTERRFTKII